jgi:hypothetical protein
MLIAVSTLKKIGLLWSWLLKKLFIDYSVAALKA